MDVWICVSVGNLDVWTLITWKLRRHIILRPSVQLVFLFGFSVASKRVFVLWVQTTLFFAVEIYVLRALHIRRSTMHDCTRIDFVRGWKFLQCLCRMPLRFGIPVPRASKRVLHASPSSTSKPSTCIFLTERFQDLNPPNSLVLTWCSVSKHSYRSGKYIYL